MQRKAKGLFRTALIALVAIAAATINVSSAEASETPSFSWTVPASYSTADGFVFPALDPVSGRYQGCAWANFTLASNGTNTSAGANFTVSGLNPGESSTFTAGYICAGATIYPSVTITGTAMREGLVPLFGTPIATSTGFTVSIDNFDSNFNYVVNTLPASTATISSSGIVSVSGVAPNTQVSLSVITSRAGYFGAQARTFISTSAASTTLPRPIVTNLVSTADGFTFVISNLNSAQYFASIDFVTGTAPAGGDTDSQGSPTFRISGLTPGQQASISVRFGSHEGNSVSSEVVVVGSALPPLAAPLYQSAFAQSATSAFVTWGSVDGATGYTVTASNGGGTCTNTVNYCTVTGLTAGQTYTFSVVATRGGQSSQASVTTPVLMASALDVGGSLTSATWKVGAVVVANPLIIGQYSILRHQWYRCAAAVGVQEAAPACDAISGATGGTYTLTAADLGKYVTSHMTVTGGVGVVSATLANTRAALAANAAGGALVDPDGKPLIADIPTRQISVVGGTTITITGTGFKDVTSVLVNGTPATVLSATDTTLVISVPASTQVGLVDLAVTTPKGTVTEASALAYVAKQASISSKKKTLTGFSGSVTKLSTKQKAEIKAFVKANSTMPKLTCAATTVGVKKSSTEAKAALARAKAACSYAASVSKNVFTSSNGAQGKTTGKVSKLVTLTISN